MLMKFGCIRGQSAQRHQCADGGRIHHLDQLAQFVVRAGVDDAAARVHHGTLGFPHRLRRAPDLSGVAFGINFVARQMNRAHRRIMAVGPEHVLGDIDQHRSGAAAGGDVKRFVNRICGSSASVFTRKLCLVPERVMPKVSAS